MSGATANYVIVAFAERRDLMDAASGIEGEAFPRFVLEGDDVWRRLFPRLLDVHARFQFFLCDPNDGALLAICNAVPFRWTGKVEDLPLGLNDVMIRSLEEHERGVTPTALCAIQVAVATRRKGLRLGAAVMSELQRLARAHGIKHVVSPIRPATKHEYPHMPIDEFARRRDQQGRAADWWLRSQESLGARIIGVAPDSNIITATVGEWEQWTGCRFPTSGEYLIPGGLVPLVVDRERDVGRYAEPHVWVEYATGETRGAAPAERGARQ